MPVTSKENTVRPLGLAIISAACLLPLVWLPSLAADKDLIALFSQYLGLVALISMAFAQVIATRWSGVETVFGPLDQSYRVHKWLGIGALVAILLHDTIDAEMRGLGTETLLVEVAETMGEISLYGLLILVVITVATFVPYHLWKWTHRFIGIFFILGSFHYLFILKPFSNSDPLGLYMAVICASGTIAYLYTSAPRGLRPSHPYRINALRREGNALAVEMTPEGRPLRHTAGQFSFFAFTGAGLSEPHPFTISSAPRDDGKLEVTVAPLGDLTSRVMKALRADLAVQVDGPFGRFGQHVPGVQVWIAAGVGITPFVALSEALASTDGPVSMIYSVRSREEAAHLERLEGLSTKNANFRLTVWESEEKGRLTPDEVARIVGSDMTAANVLFCGPVPMRQSFSKGLQRHGISQDRFHYEEFEIRTGIGLRYLLRWLWAKREQSAVRSACP